MTLANLSPEPKMLGTSRTRHPLRKEQPRHYICFHSHTHFQEESRGPHPGREGFAHPIHTLLCIAPEIGQQSERRVGLRIKLANPRLPRIKQSMVDNIHMPASGDDYRRRLPSRTVLLLVRWPEGRAAPRSQRSRSQSTLSSATFKCSGGLVGKVCAERHGQLYVEDGISSYSKYFFPPNRGKNK
jgi:hypothetical protein